MQNDMIKYIQNLPFNLIVSMQYQKEIAVQKLCS